MNEEKDGNIETKTDEKKEGLILSIIVNFAFWFFIILYLELTYRASMGFGFNTESVINILLYAIMLGSGFSITSRIFKDKVNNWITGIILVILGVLFSLQCVFTKILKTNFTISNLALGDQAAVFIGDALERNICKYFICNCIPFAIYSIFNI